jgi:hypothetical protein
VEQLCARSATEGVETIPKPPLKLVGSHGRLASRTQQGTDRLEQEAERENA